MKNRSFKSDNDDHYSQNRKKNYQPDRLIDFGFDFFFDSIKPDPNQKKKQSKITDCNMIIIIYFI